MQIDSISRVVMLAMTLLAAPALAQDMTETSEPQNGGVFQLLPSDAIKEQNIRLEEQPLPYTTTAGTLVLFDQDGKRAAKIFYTAYVAKGRAAERPVTFLFNGGPGAASAYLHLGLAGPRTLEFGENQNDGTQPVLKDNPDSWLAFTDLVFIDPVGTGWSRAVSNKAAGDFYGVRQDANSIAKAIALYTQKNDRISSPKYLAGESYGGFRAAKVASSLKDTQGILVSGIIMVSPMIEGRFVWGSDVDPLSAALRLPSLAAAELERKKAFDRGLVDEAHAFAMSDYLMTLAGPSHVTAEDERVYSRVAALTGISNELVVRTRGFLEDIYQKQSAGDGRIVSPYDAGRVVPDAYPEALASRNDDPVLDGYTRAYGAAFAAYARHELGFDTPMTYMLLNDDANHRWEWNGGRSEDSRVSASAATDIRDLLSVIPQLRLLVAHGYSDTLTPYGFSQYVLDHLPPELVEDRVALKLYRGGHMFYADPASRAAFSAEVGSFFEHSGQRQ